MSLPGLLVEYLINGCIALVWLFSFPKVQELSKLIEDEKLFLVPIAYVLGMFIDFIAWLTTHPAKRFIRADALRVVQTEMKRNGNELDADDYKLFWKEKVEIEKRYPDLNKELQSRSSRDRIARGTMLNLVPICILYWEDIGWLGLAIFLASVMMWIRFEHYNRCFEIRAAISIREEIKEPKN